MTDTPSRSQIKKAGSQIRKFMRGDSTDLDKTMRAIDTMENWRRAHYIPLVSANNGLRSRAKTAKVDAEVTQRLKRRQTILEKLRREPSLDLSLMQDIGGCRAVIESGEDLRKLEHRITSRLEVVNYSDYTENARKSGYRAVHVVVRYQGRAVEIQLRTKSMHAWALASENYSALVGQNLKQDGDHPIQQFLAVASDIMWLTEKGEPIPTELAELHKSLRLTARPYLTGGTQ